MWRPVFLLALLLAPAGFAQTAKVTSGEHGAFTRLVVELPAAAEWRLGRTGAGYELDVASPEGLRYDLTAVWDRIARTRLSGLWADPGDGALQLSLACDCHAFPFEFQPGTLVIDLRDGPAPPGSVFEDSLEANPVAAPAAGSAAVPAPSGQAAAGYDWRAAASSPAGAEGDDAPALPLPLATGGVSLGPLRDALLLEISRGAAEGMVDMTLARRRGTPQTAPAAEFPWAQIALGALPGAGVRDTDATAGALQPDGAACIADERLAVADWGGEQPVVALIAEARAGLIGEFDVPDPLAVKRAVRQHLHLGFGAEALQYLDLIEAPATDADLAVYASLARILDGEEDAASPFGRMLGCDGAAALWSALLHVRLPAGNQVNVAAVLRSFAALPPHLRQHLGPGLADRFLAAGDTEAARMVRDATARVEGVARRDVALIDAKMGLGEGRLAAAEAHAEAALAEGGPSGLDAALTLVETHFRSLDPVGPDLLATVASYRAETAGTAAEPGLRRAHVLALGLAGHPFEALAELAATPETGPDFWQVIAARATDAELVGIAVLRSGSPRPAVREATAETVATRLLDLGFADAALHWLGAPEATLSPGSRILAARAELARGDARAAGGLTAGLDAPEARAVAAEALLRLGDIEPAAEAWRAAGDATAADRLTIWNRDWASVAKGGNAPWNEAALLALPGGSAVPEGGLLAKSTALATDSARARDTITRLLAAVPDPAGIR